MPAAPGCGDGGGDGANEPYPFRGHPLEYAGRAGEAGRILCDWW